MSNDILGAIVTTGAHDALEAHLAAVAKHTPLGLFRLEGSAANRILGKFVTDLSSKSVAAVRITDGPSKHNATYLIDGLDYVPESKLELPIKSADRLQLLVVLVDAIFDLKDITRLDLALMDSSQLEEMRELKLREFRDALIADMLQYSPPDTLYRITRS